jgi:hypothetical protein
MKLAGDPFHSTRQSTQGQPAAPCVDARACSSTPPEHLPTPPEDTGRSATTQAGQVYLEAVLDLYCWLPITPMRASRLDRRLAKRLYEQGIPLAAVKGALLLGAARRTFRNQDSLPLPRTLHYFLPLVEEVLQDPPGSDYLEYLKAKLQLFAEAKAIRLGPRGPSFPTARRPRPHDLAQRVPRNAKDRS